MNRALVFSDNDVTMSAEGTVAFYVDNDDVELYDGDSVDLSNNLYRDAGCEECFRWGELATFEQWQSFGSDAGVQVIG